MKNLDQFQQFGLGGGKDADPNNKRAVIYSRVSTKGQEDNTSLANQYEVCRNYVDREGLEVVAEFGGKGESAKEGSARQEYERMLKYVRLKRNRIRYVVFYAYDRFSREGGKAIVTKQELKALGISVKSATMPIDTSNPYGEGMEDMQLIFAKIENDVRRKRCIDGTRAKLREGKWCGTAPIGYIWQNGEMLIHPEKGPLVRKAFKWKYDNPDVTSEEIRRRLRKLGLHIPKQSMSQMLRNPLYCGLMAHSLLDGEVVRGKHEPIVSKKVFLAVTGAMQKNNTRGWRVDEENALLPLKRFMVCECCGKTLTGYLNRRKNGKPRPRPLPYYKCKTTGCRVSLNANKMGEVFLTELNKYRIDPELVPLISQQVRLDLTELNAERFKEADRMEKRVAEMKRKLNRLRERYVLEEAVSREDYEEFSKKLRDEKGELDRELHNIREKSSNLLDRIEEVIQISSNLGHIWTNGDYRAKQMVQKIAFPDGIVYSKKKGGVLTPRVNEVIRVSSHFSHVLGQKRKGQSIDKLALSRRVAGTGLEPATSGL